ncbi:MAG: RNase adapter RapZ [Polyangiales bacterium]
MTHPLRVWVVTGLSGAGRSTALRALEDLGCFCVDNLPPALAPELLSLVAKEGRAQAVGLGVDVRSGTFLDGARDAMIAAQEQGHHVSLIYLDCSDEVLLRRFSETRRPHVLAEQGDVRAAILSERERLAPLRSRADRVIDTSNLNVHELKRAMVQWVREDSDAPKMMTRIVSFGFKYGLPTDADMVFDLRFLPNPYFIPELKALSGLDAAVRDYVLDSDDSKTLFDDVVSLLRDTLPKYAREGKAYLTVALGCTGGRHRSVAFAEALGEELRADYEISVTHRDNDRYKA